MQSMGTSAEGSKEAIQNVAITAKVCFFLRRKLSGSKLKDTMCGNSNFDQIVTAQRMLNPALPCHSPLIACNGFETHAAEDVIGPCSNLPSHMESFPSGGPCYSEHQPRVCKNNDLSCFLFRICKTRMLTHTNPP